MTTAVSAPSQLPRRAREIVLSSHVEEGVDGHPLRVATTFVMPGGVALIMDNYATHKRVEVRDWLADTPRLKVHFTPTSGRG